MDRQNEWSRGWHRLLLRIPSQGVYGLCEIIVERCVQGLVFIRLLRFDCDNQSQCVVPFFKPRVFRNLAQKVSAYKNFTFCSILPPSLFSVVVLHLVWREGGPWDVLTDVCQCHEVPQERVCGRECCTRLSEYRMAGNFSRSPSPKITNVKFCRGYGA